MASVTWNVNKDTIAAHNTSTGADWGAGKDIHLPVGYQSWLPGWARVFLGFSYSFTGMVTITSAILHMETSDGFHVANDNDPDIYVDLVTSSWSEGTSGADEVWNTNGGGVTGDHMPSVSAANRVSWDVGGGSAPSDNTFYTVDVTDLVNQAFTNGVFYGLRLMSIQESDATENVEFWSREKGSTHDAYIVVTYTTNNAPNAPTGLTPTGNAIQNTLTPTFAGTFSDPDAGDSMTGVEIVVYADDGTTVKWDSGTLSASGSTFSKTYAGPALTGNTFYKWKARTKDAAGAWGAYSALQRFKVNSTPSSPTVSLVQSPTTDVKTLTPTFQLTHNDPDPSDTKAYKYQIILETSTGTAVWDSGEISLGTAATSISKVYNGSALSWQSSYRWKARTQDSNGAWSPYSPYQTFTTHTTGVPTNLAPSGSQIASSTGPTLTGQRASTADTLASAEVEVYQSDGSTLVWASGVFTTGVSSTAFSKVTGTTLIASSTYKWRARVTGSIGGTSAWSALATFITPDATAAHQDSPLGTGITDSTPDFTFSRGANFNRHELYLYSEDDNFASAIWSSTPSSYTATGSKSVTSGVTLDFGKRYRWSVRVSADGGTNWSPYAGPSEFTMDIAGVPTLTAPISDSWQTTLTPTFTGDTASAETISTYRIKLYASDQSTLIWDSGDLSGSGTSFSKVYNGSTALTKGSRYYWQASYIKTAGVPGGYSTLASFHINADPNAPTNRTPATGYIYGDDSTPVAPTFLADFSDADITTWGDVASLFEVEVYRNSDSVLMYTLSKSANLNGSTNSMTDGDADVTKTTSGGADLTIEVEYKWRARFTDSKGAAGSWSSYNVFKATQPPTATITAPGVTVNSPNFDITWSFSSPGSKAQSAYRVRVLRHADLVSVYDTGKVVSAATTFTLPAGYLQNGTDYDIDVTVYDSDDVASTEDSWTTTTDWTAPDAPEEFTATSDPDSSTVVLEWVQTNLGSDFSHYAIYRREVGDAAWTRMTTLLNEATLTYSDFFAANGVLYDYKITVFKAIPGDADLESVDSDISSVILDADVWYVIGADRSAEHSFELPVQRGPFTEPIQQEVFEPVGTDRKTIVRGKVLGAEGTLDVYWTESDVATAKRRLAYIRDNSGPHILKSPFGDVWEVEFSGPVKDYQGGGHLKATLSWTEVE